MNVAELKAALANYPDDMVVAVQEEGRDGRELDLDIYVQTAYSHPDVRIPRWGTSYTWHWTDDEDGEEHGGVEVLVIY